MISQRPRFLPIILLCSTLAIHTGCGKSGDRSQQVQDTMDMGSGDHAAHANTQMDSGEPTDESIYNVSSTWQNRHGHRVQLDSLRGKVQVLAMVYTHCEYACPRILADMKRIRDSLSDEVRDRTNFVIISIDPQRDTPDRLYRFAEENKLSDEQWTLLNGDAGDVLEIAALLGVRYKRLNENDFTHSNIITVLNRAGEVVHQRKKLTDRQTATVEQIEKLGAG